MGRGGLEGGRILASVDGCNVCTTAIMFIFFPLCCGTTIGLCLCVSCASTCAYKCALHVDGIDGVPVALAK